jgi:hypothetical protein
MAGQSTRVPKTMQRTYDAVTSITDAFCRDHLNDEYAHYANLLAAALCRKRPSLLINGRPRTWACGVLYALGQINFLSDKSFEPYMILGDLCDRMGVGKSTGSAKSRTISDAFGLLPFHPAWMLPSLMERNPLSSLFEIRGLPAGMDHLRGQVQAAALREVFASEPRTSGKRDALLKDYRRLRKISSHHQSTLAGAVIGAQAAEIAVRIGLAKNARAVASMDFNDVSPALDLALFSKGPDGTSLVERYFDEKRRHMKRRDRAVVEAMVNSRFSVFATLDRHPDAGVVLVDMTTGEEVWLMDLGSEASLSPGHQVAFRLFQPGKFHMTTGVVASMNRDEVWEAVERRQSIRYDKDDLLVIGERDAFAEAVYATAIETGALAAFV